MPSKSKVQNQPKSANRGPSVFDDDLSSGEKLLWQSRAGAGAFALAHVRAVFMGVTFMLVAIVWNVYAHRVSAVPELVIATWLFAALGVVYIGVPLWAYVVGKWFLFYALTDKRLLILQVFPKRKITQFPIESLNRVVQVGGQVGNSTLLIDAPGAVSKMPTKPRAGFYGVKYATKLEEAVFALQYPEQALKRAQVEAAAKVKAVQPMAPSAPPAPGAAAFTPSSHAPR